MQTRNLILLPLLLLCTLLRAQVAAPVGGNSLWMTKSGEEYLNRLLEDIDQAHSTIEIEYYWFDADKAGKLVRDALIRKAQEGVKVRVLMDNLITLMAPEYFYRKMRKAGIEVAYVHDFDKLCLGESVASIFGFRDHRKIVVIDGAIAYTGGKQPDHLRVARHPGAHRRPCSGTAAGHFRAGLEPFHRRNGGTRHCCKKSRRCCGTST